MELLTGRIEARERGHSFSGSYDEFPKYLAASVRLAGDHRMARLKTAGPRRTVPAMKTKMVSTQLPFAVGRRTVKGPGWFAVGESARSSYSLLTSAACAV